MFEVQNQPPPLEPYNLFASDVVLREAVIREGAGWAKSELSVLGATLGKPETIQLGFDANKFPPQLRTLDRYGHRLDEVEFHPAWHELLGLALKAGLHSGPWAEPKPGAHAARAAGTYMLGQIESGVYCPVAMTYGSVPSLRHTPAIAAEWMPRIFSREYDRRFRPADLKSAALIGMGMTENQGGSDLRTNTTRAERSDDGAYRLFGHKWFMSAPMCDAFLVLAQSPKGLSCFLDAAMDARRRAQRHSNSSTEGQTRQSLECVRRSGISRCLRAARRGGGARHSDHNRNGQLHAARLLHRLFGVDAAGGRAGDTSCSLSLGLPEEVN